MVYKVPAPTPTAVCHFATNVIRPLPPVPCANQILSHLVPMDIDMGQNKNLTPPTCYRCNRPGNKAPDCPLRFDIRELTLEELKMELMARMDIARAEILPSKEEEVAPEEDFVQDS